MAAGIPKIMKALVFDGNLKLREVPIPARQKGEVLIKVEQAGICNTDLEITRGYIPGFNGIPGHEFFGKVAAADSPKLIGRQVTSEINMGCGKCVWCVKGLERHCPGRQVLGIQNRNGAFAEYVVVPEKNVIPIPDEITGENAIFIEPLSAALEILEQVAIHPNHSILLVGDGKLGQLIAEVLLSLGCGVDVVGRHPQKLKRLAQLGAGTAVLSDFAPRPFDLVIEASGNPGGFQLAQKCLKPRGILVLKSTYARHFEWNPSSLVVNEFQMVGSRCGRFQPAVDYILKNSPDFSTLIDKYFPLEHGEGAFGYAARSGALKVVIQTGL